MPVMGPAKMEALSLANGLQNPGNRFDPGANHSLNTRSGGDLVHRQPTLLSLIGRSRPFINTCHLYQLPVSMETAVAKDASE